MSNILEFPGRAKAPSDRILEAVAKQCDEESRRMINEYYHRARQDMLMAEGSFMCALQAMCDVMPRLSPHDYKCSLDFVRAALEDMLRVVREQNAERGAG